MARTVIWKNMICGKKHKTTISLCLGGLQHMSVKLWIAESMLNASSGTNSPHCDLPHSLSKNGMCWKTWKHGNMTLEKLDGINLTHNNWTNSTIDVHGLSFWRLSRCYWLARPWAPHYAAGRTSATWNMTMIVWKENTDVQWYMYALSYNCMRSRRKQENASCTNIKNI